MVVEGGGEGVDDSVVEVGAGEDPFAACSKTARRLRSCTFSA